MFTGIIEEIGTVNKSQNFSDKFKLIISAKLILENIKSGDSIAVNGACLTVSSFDVSGFTSDIMPISLEKSNLGNLKHGEKVNLERALSFQSRLGGHLVNGHIDGIGTIKDRKENKNAVLFEIEVSSKLKKYLIPEGSIAVDGVSLTIAEITEHGFIISIIPHTLEQTIFQYKKVGDIVNLENDLIGKYIYSFMKKNNEKTNESNITKQFLAEKGFFEE